MADDFSRRDDSLKEETSATGERVKGASKDALGSVTGNRRLEREGELENAAGRARQANNDVFDETDGVPGRTVNDSVSSGRGSGSGTLAEEASAAGQRAKGATKDAVGSVLGLNRMEREGEAENAAGRARQGANDVDLNGPDSPSLSTSDTPYRTTDTSNSNRNLVTGLYDTPEHAGRAYNDLTTKHGYKSDDVSVLMSDETRQRHFGDVKPGTEFKTGSKAAEGAGVGGAAGISVGAVLGGLLAAATSIAIPGIGLVVAGPLAGAIAGAGAGGAAGTLIGALIGAGIPEERAKVYDEGIRGGGIVLGTRARDEAHAAELERDFTTYGGRDIRR
ncbi:MAG: CsbD family protein [Acidobacteriota bacterium]|nr:CsbD family protein [Acidobacteriota bacterium]